MAIQPYICCCVCVCVAGGGGGGGGGWGRLWLYSVPHNSVPFCSAYLYDLYVLFCFVLCFRGSPMHNVTQFGECA